MVFNGAVCETPKSIAFVTNEKTDFMTYLNFKIMKELMCRFTTGKTGLAAAAVLLFLFSSTTTAFAQPTFGSDPESKPGTFSFMPLSIGDKTLKDDFAPAATFVVTKTADTNDGTCDADCSLREAITAANSSAANDTIIFSANGTITLGSVLPNLANNGTLSITGNGAGLTIISGNNAVRPLKVATGATFTLSGLTATNGNSVNDGGGLYIDTGASVFINNCTFSNNTSAIRAAS
jgi:CSLREA domain-containing protein